MSTPEERQEQLDHLNDYRKDLTTFQRFLLWHFSTIAFVGSSTTLIAMVILRQFYGPVWWILGILGVASGVFAACVSIWVMDKFYLRRRRRERLKEKEDE